MPLYVEDLTLTGSAIKATGNSLSNHIDGNSGDNKIDGRTGADSMAGHGGNDIYIVDNANDTVDENTNEGIDTILSSVSRAGSNALEANVENLTLTGISVINGSGNSLDNILVGNVRANALNGDSGNDTINGFGGNDIITGGLGVDVLTGGTGVDKFVLLPNDSGLGVSADTITDFNRLIKEKIDLSAIDAQGTSGGTNEAFSFIGTKPFTAEGQLRYTISNGVATIQANTSGAADAEFEIVVTGEVALKALAAADFIL